MSEPVTTSAARYVAARKVERDLRRRRNARVCEHGASDRDVDGAAPALHPDGDAWGSLACWRMIDIEGPEWASRERYGDGSPRGWCASCVERQRLHVELAGAVRWRVGAWAALRAAVRALEVGNE